MRGGGLVTWLVVVVPLDPPPSISMKRRCRFSRASFIYKSIHALVYRFVIMYLHLSPQVQNSKDMHIKIMQPCCCISSPAIVTLTLVDLALS